MTHVHKIGIGLSYQWLHLVSLKQTNPNISRVAQTIVDTPCYGQMVIWPCGMDQKVVDHPLVHKTLPGMESMTITITIIITITIMVPNLVPYLVLLLTINYFFPYQHEFSNDNKEKCLFLLDVSLTTKLPRDEIEQERTIGLLVNSMNTNFASKLQNSMDDWDMALAYYCSSGPWNDATYPSLIQACIGNRSLLMVDEGIHQHTNVGKVKKVTTRTCVGLRKTDNTQNFSNNKRNSLHLQISSKPKKSDLERIFPCPFKK